MSLKQIVHLTPFIGNNMKKIKIHSLEDLDDYVKETSEEVSLELLTDVETCLVKCFTGNLAQNSKKLDNGYMEIGVGGIDWKKFCLTITALHRNYLRQLQFVS